MRFVACMIFTAIPWCGSGQPLTPKALLLPTPVTISGQVTDDQGNGIPDAMIAYLYLDTFSAAKSDADGRFSVSTRGPAMVFRKFGFDSVFVRAQASESDIKVVLKKPRFSLKPCTTWSHCIRLKGWSAAFCFPRVKGVVASAQGNDADYGARWFVVQTARGTQGIRDGSGPTWSSGGPNIEEVWSSVEFKESLVSLPGGGGYVSARGKNGNGRFWAYLSGFPEAADYRDADAEHAQLLNKVLDGACIIKTQGF